MTCGSGSHYTRTIQFPQLSSLSLFSHFMYKCPHIPLKKQCRTIRHIAASVSITFARGVRLQSYPHPRTSTSSRFLLVCTLSTSSFPFVRVFPVLFPRTQTGYKCVFLFFSLSQFYGSRNPRAPVFVVCLCSCLLTQRPSGASPVRFAVLPKKAIGPRPDQTLKH